MAKEVYFIADDLGMTHEINEAIVHAHLAGALSGAALMMAQPGTDDAVQRARNHPTLQIGWHLHLNDSRPATTEAWPWGASPALAGFQIGISQKAQALMRLEVERQWELFQATGLECRFINSHHHLHAHPMVYHALLETVGPRFKGWIRLGQPRSFKPAPAFILWRILGLIYLERRRKLSAWRASDTLWGIDRIFKMESGEVRDAMAQLPDGLHEFLFHPRTLSSPDTLCLVELKSSSLS